MKVVQKYTIDITNYDSTFFKAFFENKRFLKMQVERPDSIYFDKNRSECFYNYYDITVYNGKIGFEIEIWQEMPSNSVLARIIRDGDEINKDQSWYSGEIGFNCFRFDKHGVSNTIIQEGSLINLKTGELMCILPAPGKLSELLKNS